MLEYPLIDPVALDLGAVKIHWYGIMYLVGFAAAWWLGQQRAKLPNSGWSSEQIGDLIFYCALGVVIGGRLGYALFYDFANIASSPLSLFKIWEGGMSFHGGLLGVIVAMWLYGRKLGKSFFQVADFVAPLVPIGLGAGRLGNFINGELWGKATDLPWGIIFPHAGNFPRHPSQLYEALLEGLVLFLILWFYSKKPRPLMALSGLFLIGYGSFRFLVEFVRIPDEGLGYLAMDWLTMGQILSTPMVILGIVLMTLAYKQNRSKSA